MRAPRGLVPTLAVALLVLLLAGTALLQWRWIGELGEAERARRTVELDRAAHRFAEELDRELGGLVGTAAPRPDAEDLALRLEAWRRTALVPEILAGVYEAGANGLARFDLDHGRFEAIATTPPELAEVVSGIRPYGPPPRTASPFVFVFPRPGPPGERTFLVVLLDEQAIVGRLLPELARRDLADAEAIVAARETPDRPLWSSPPGTHFAPGAATIAIPLFAVGAGPPPERRAEPPPGEPPSAGNDLRPRRGPPPGPNDDARPRRRAFDPSSRPLRERPADTPSGIAPPNGQPTPHWVLVVRPGHGSLEDAIERSRSRNLALAGGILLLLAASLTLVVVWSLRAERLARRKLDFMAGISHELRTPLTALRAAGQNLADGVVDDPKKIRRYGRLVADEAERLGERVTEVLDFAAFDRGGERLALAPTTVAELVDGALAELAAAIETRGAVVERDLPDGLPSLRIDVGRLRRALRNLIDNALKYGDGWVGISARSGAHGLRLTVADRGPGIDREDLGRLFEPFERGRRQVAGRIPGSGLGLAQVRRIVEAHGGRARVESDRSGSRFTIELPRTALLGRESTP